MMIYPACKASSLYTRAILNKKGTNDMTYQSLIALKAELERWFDSASEIARSWVDFENEAKNILYVIRQHEGSIEPNKPATSDHVNDKDVVEIGSEISLILDMPDEEKLQNISAEVRRINNEADNQGLAVIPRIADYLRLSLSTREPVSVSLEKCAEALHGQIIGAGEFNDWWHGEKKGFGREFLGNMVKAVLDAAGVKYE